MFVPALIAISGGMAFGVIDRLTSHGPTWAFDLSNVGAFWLVAAFLAGMMGRSRAEGAALGLICLTGALLGYYGYMFVAENGTSLRYLLWRADPWIFASMVVGPLFGVLGAEWRLRRSPISVPVLAAAFCLDGFGYYVWAGWHDKSNTLVHLGVVLIGVTVGSALLVLRRRGGPSSARRPDHPTHHASQ